MQPPPTAMPAADVAAWLRRWEAMMAGSFAERERQLALPLDAAEVLVGREFAAVDLGAGPGSTSRRLLARFPRARCVAVDLNPLMLALGPGAQAKLAGRLTWLEANLADAGWPERAGVGTSDLAIATSAFHSLPPAICRSVHTVLRPGGILLNGDTMRFGPEAERAGRAAEVINGRHRDAPRDGQRREQFREALAADPWLGPLYAERERRFAALRVAESVAPTLADHGEAARAAGFREVGTIWQHLDFRVLLAVRPPNGTDVRAPGGEGG